MLKMLIWIGMLTSDTRSPVLHRVFRKDWQESSGMVSSFLKPHVGQVITVLVMMMFMFMMVLVYVQQNLSRILQ